MAEPWTDGYGRIVPPTTTSRRVRGRIGSAVRCNGGGKKFARAGTSETFPSVLAYFVVKFEALARSHRRRVARENSGPAYTIPRRGRTLFARLLTRDSGREPFKIWLNCKSI